MPVANIGFCWVIPIIFFLLFLFLVVFRNWVPPFWHSRKISEEYDYYKNLSKEKSEIENLKYELSKLQKKIKEMENGQNE